MSPLFEAALLAFLEQVNPRVCRIDRGTHFLARRLCSQDTVEDQVLELRCRRRCRPVLRDVVAITAAVQVVGNDDAVLLSATISSQPSLPAPAG